MNLDKRRKYFIIGTLFIPAAFFFLYLDLREGLSGSMTQLISLTFPLIMFYAGGKFLYKGWKNDKNESTDVRNLKLKRMIAIGIAILMVILIILSLYSK